MPKVSVSACKDVSLKTRVGCSGGICELSLARPRFRCLPAAGQRSTANSQNTTFGFVNSWVLKPFGNLLRFQIRFQKLSLPGTCLRGYPQVVPKTAALRTNAFCKGLKNTIVTKPLPRLSRVGGNSKGRPKQENSKKCYGKSALTQASSFLELKVY